MRATAQFADPSDIPVSITLSGSLAEFEALRAELVGSNARYYCIQALVEQISDASSSLRAKVSPPPSGIRPEIDE